MFIIAKSGFNKNFLFENITNRRADIEEAARRCRRNPGEPKLTLELTLTGKTTKAAVQGIV